MSDNIDILVKLFETLKTSTDKNEESTKQLIIQQLELVNQIKSLPIDDLRQALKEHASTSSKDIDSCSETVTATSTDLMVEVRKLTSKINKLLIAISVIISVATTGYFVIKATVDSEAIIEKNLQKKFDLLSSKITKERTKEIEKLREEIGKFHTDGSLPK